MLRYSRLYGMAIEDYLLAQGERESEANNLAEDNLPKHYDLAARAYERRAAMERIEAAYNGHLWRAKIAAFIHGFFNLAIQ